MIYWFSGALAAVLLLLAVAPRPAWVALAIAGAGAFAAVEAVPSAPPSWPGCPNGASACIQIGWYTGEEDHEPSFIRFLYDWPTVPAWLVVAGVLGWAIRRRSWRTAIASAVYGAAVFVMPYEAPIVLLAAAAAAIGPRRDAHYLAGVGLFALAWTDLPWTLLITITVTLALGIRAVATKNGVNAAAALVSLASAPLTPFLSAGVLLTTVLIRRTAARSAGTPNPRPARPDQPGTSPPPRP
ncbi:hypothetical protein G7043_42985 [Lentzea sp. NEAU-D13]|uniref:Uncharacterized protein n=1 Tax=Lentzea alba TaxID=2714351 RepID=A0A7C9VZ34_9PSEU|nr:hypothetical protein [Lentzea alba]NGY65675.1 hypothetical protein [Lentzea alba]